MSKFAKLSVVAVILSSLLVSCTSINTTSSSITDGSYTKEVDGRNGKMKIETVIKDGKIDEVNVLEHTESAGIADGALEFIPEKIVSGNTINVEAISGATITSEAIIEAVKQSIVEAGGKAEDFEKEVSETSKEVKKLEADVVVVGAGSSGMASAISASENGANVILIEKTNSIGGGALVAWAGKGYGSSYQEEAKVEIDVEPIISEWIRDSHWRVDASAIRQYVKESGKTFTWLKENGLETTLFVDNTLHMLPSDYSKREELYSGILDNTVVKNGGQVIKNTTAKNLIQDENGNVVGVKAEQVDGTILEISAKSVILATGGYAGNAEMVKDAFGFEGPLGGLAQNVGEGIQMAWEVGAKIPNNYGGQMLHQTLAKGTDELKKTYDDFKASYPLMLTYLPNFMNVGKTGARFRDESYTLEAVAAANSSAYQGSFHYTIVSKAQLDNLQKSGMAGVNAPQLPGMPPEFYMTFKEQFALDTPWTDVHEVFDKMVENGHGFKGNSIEELAENAGMDVEIFKETVTNYEEFCKTGVDEEFNKLSDYLITLGSEGPYYAIITEVNNLNSIGGLYLNNKYQVLNENDLPIKGLYAVGVESLGMMYNDTYVGHGVGLGNAFTSGRLAGINAAKESKE